MRQEAFEGFPFEKGARHEPSSDPSCGHKGVLADNICCRPFGLMCEPVTAASLRHGRTFTVVLEPYASARAHLPRGRVGVPHACVWLGKILGCGELSGVTCVEAPGLFYHNAAYSPVVQVVGCFLLLLAWDAEILHQV